MPRGGAKGATAPPLIVASKKGPLFRCRIFENSFAFSRQLKKILPVFLLLLVFKLIFENFGPFKGKNCIISFKILDLLTPNKLCLLS